MLPVRTIEIKKPVKATYMRNKHVPYIASRLLI